MDGLVHISDAMVTSQKDFMVETTRSKKLPLILQDRESVVSGGLASYGLSYYQGGRLTAKYVQRVLQGASPAELPVEQIDRLQLIINMTTVKIWG